MSQPEAEITNYKELNDSAGREDILNSSLTDCNIGLPVFPTQFEYLMVSNYEILATIGTAEEAETFISDYSTNSGSEWRVLRTFTKLPTTLVYKRAWRCQYNVQQRRKVVRDLNKIKVSKNFQCPGYICISVYSGNSIKKHGYISDLRGSNYKGLVYPCSIKLNLDHNHSLNSKDVLRHRTLDPSIKDKIMNMFHYGHGASAAIKLHLLDLLMINEDQYFNLIQDGKYMPSVSQIQHYLNNVKPNLELYEVKEIIDQYTLRNPEAQVRYFYVQSEANKVITIITPLMAKVHQFVPRSGELLSITLSSKINRLGTKFLTLSTHSSLGTLPLGLIILQQHEDLPGGKENVLQEILEEFTRHLTLEVVFHGLGYPRVILTDNDLVPIVSRVYSQSIVLVSQSSTLQTVWTWLQDVKNGIHFSEREGFFYSFKKIMVSKTPEEVEKNFSRFVRYCSDGCPSYLKFIESLMIYKESWVDYYRTEKLRKNSLEHITLEDTTLSEVEIISSYVFDQMLMRIRNLLVSLPEVLNFVINHLETYFNIRLLKFSNAKQVCLTKSMLSKYLETEEHPPSFSIQPSDFDKDCYFVISKDNNFYVDYKNKLCSCSKKMHLGPCVHINTILAHMYKASKYVLIEESEQDMAQSLLTEQYNRLKIDDKSIIVINTYCDPKDEVNVYEGERDTVKTEEMGELEEEKVPDESACKVDNTVDNGELYGDKTIAYEETNEEHINVQYAVECSENIVEYGETHGGNNVKYECDTTVEDSINTVEYTQINNAGNNIECTGSSEVHIEYVTLDVLSDLEYDLTEPNANEKNVVDINDGSTTVVKNRSIKRKLDDVNTTVLVSTTDNSRYVRQKIELNTNEHRNQNTTDLLNQMHGSICSQLQTENIGLKNQSGNEVISSSPSESINNCSQNSSGKLVNLKSVASEISNLKGFASQMPELFSGAVVEKKKIGDQTKNTIFLKRQIGYETEVKYSRGQSTLEQHRDAVVSLSDNVIIIDPKLKKSESNDIEVELKKLNDISEKIKSNPSEYRTVLRNMISVYETFYSDV
ncbi:hypothetical protein WDU94_013523 [Cyamophila willieti]